MKKFFILWLFLIVCNLKGFAGSQTVILYELKDNCDIVHGGKNKPTKSISKRGHLYVIENDGYLMFKSPFKDCNNLCFSLFNSKGEIIYSDTFSESNIWLFLPLGIWEESELIQVECFGKLYQGNIFN